MEEHEIEVTQYENLNKDVGHFSLEGIFDDVKYGVWQYLVDPLRQMLMEGNAKGYSASKLKLPAITPCALFNGRRIQPNILRYNQIIILDFDKMTPEEMKRLKTLICLCLYTYACFVSPSGNGLKVFVRVSTCAEQHKMAFLAVQQFYMALTGFEIDPSGKDVTRLCFVSYDPDLYYNPNAVVFVPLEGEIQTWPPAAPDKPVLGDEKKNESNIGNEGNVGAANGNAIENQNNENGRPQGRPLHFQQLPDKLSDGSESSKDIPSWATHQPVSRSDSNSDYDKIQRCKDYVERHCSFVVGQRHTYVFALAIQFRCRGFDESFTLSELLRDYNFDEKEVRSCVKYAFSYVWVNDPLYGNGRPQGKYTVEPAIGNEGNVGAALVAAHGDAIENQKNENGRPQGRPLHFQQSPAQNLPAQDTNDEKADTKPDDPTKEKRRPGRKRYEIKKVEYLISQWYETRYNVVTGVIEWRHRNSNEAFRRLEDHEENSMFRWLHHAEQKIPIQTLHNLINSDYSPDFNPFIAYAHGLPLWDGVTDYISQISATVKATDEEYWTFCFRKWFVAYAVSLINDEIINHTVIVFVGIQGVGKSSWMKLLVPKALRNYLGTAALQTDSKDTAIQLTECALIILDEMENLNRHDLASFKELITRPEIRIRRPYGRNSENLPHRASFIASVNYQQILTDPSGSRRYLCQKVLSLDYKHQINIDLAMAQAYALYKRGFKFWFDQEEIHELNERNEDFMSKSVEEELIELWFRPVTKEEFLNRSTLKWGINILLMTATQIAIKLMEKAKVTLLDNTLVKIGKAMHKLKYERVRKKNNYFYLVRMVDFEAVERDSRTLEDIETVPKPVDPVDPEALKKEQEENEQIIRLEEDLSDNSPVDDLPF